MSWNVWNRPSESFTVDMGISSKIMKPPSPKCYITFWDMTIYNGKLNWSGITPICELITELDFITDFDFITNFGGFHRTLQRVRLANRGRLLLRTPGPVQIGTCIWSYVGAILSWTCHVYGPFEFQTSLGTSLFFWSTCNYWFLYGFVWNSINIKQTEFFVTCLSLKVRTDLNRFMVIQHFQCRTSAIL